MKIAVLGAEGLTGRAVINKIHQRPDHLICDLHEADIIVASPGIPPEQYPQTSTPIISEIELAWRLISALPNPPRIIAITGTNGKTTITSLIGHLLDCPVAGNIGQPLISFVPDPAQTPAPMPDFIALELSSYQLETTFTIKPIVSIISNITEDHLTRHKTMQNYISAKSRIFQAQDQHDLFIHNQADPLITELIPLCPAALQPFTPAIDPFNIPDHLRLPGIHNIENALAACYAARFAGLSTPAIQQKLACFTGVEHRIEYVASINGVHCYNDSKATNPESTMTAINALDGPGILILGGRDKLTTLDPMCRLIKTKIAHVMLIGEATDRFEQALRVNDFTDIHREADLAAAVKKGLALATDEKYLLLSPACASFDMYKNFEDRGKHFKNIIMELKQ